MFTRKILSILLILIGISHAQFSKSVEISSQFDDNLFRSPDPETDFLTDVMIDLNYQPEQSSFSLNYNGNMFLYQDNALRNFSLHSFGLNYSIPFGKDDKHNFDFGADYSLRVNGDDYDYYNYGQFFVYSNVRMDLEWLFMTAGYNFRNRKYTNLPDLTNNQHYVFVQANKSFDTRTTFILEADLGNKSFAGQNTITSTMSSGGGRGRGGRSGSMAESTTTSKAEIPSLNQAILLGRVAQSVHDKVGIYFQYRRQISLTDETNFINGDGYYQDEELFDDPFSYESESYSSQLTWMLPWAMKIQLGGALVSKNYISEQAFTSAEDTAAAGGGRLDDRDSYYVNLSKILYLNKSWVKSLHFNLHYNYIRSESNSYWYNYKNNVIGGGVKWNF